jgi:hypothetical protein
MAGCYFSSSRMYRFHKIDSFCDLLRRYTCSFESPQVTHAYYKQNLDRDLDRDLPFPESVADRVPQFSAQDLNYLWENSQTPWVHDVVAYRARHMEALNLEDVHQFLYGSWGQIDDLCPPTCTCRTCLT